MRLRKTHRDLVVEGTLVFLLFIMIGGMAHYWRTRPDPKIDLGLALYYSLGHRNGHYLEVPK